MSYNSFSEMSVDEGEEDAKVVRKHCVELGSRMWRVWSLSVGTTGVWRGARGTMESAVGLTLVWTLHIDR